MRLHGFWRSSAAYRVRIALALKGLQVETVTHSLPRVEHRAEAYRALNPQGFVPALETEQGVLIQSGAIIEHLDERWPEPPLLPADAHARAVVRGMAGIISADIHPLNNLRVLRYLKQDLGLSEEQKDGWYRHWVEQGLAQLEAQLAGCGRSGRFVFGDEVTLADVLLVPQIFNARRFSCRLDHVPRVMRIFDACMQVPSFESARPERQPDFA